MSADITVHLQDSRAANKLLTIQVDVQTTASDVIKALTTKARLHNQKNYELAEIFVSSGQLCKERRLDMAEHPLKVQGLWPKGGAMAPDATYRFYLVRKDSQADFMRSLSWSKCSQSVDVSMDSYLLNFLGQKKAGDDYADLCALPDLNEKTLLSNLRERFYHDKIYTCVGTILIAVNPFRFFPIYNPKYVAMYQGRQLGDLPPHIFAIADSAFTTMVETQSDQCIVISGESGSGKTENTNFLLHHLTHLTPQGMHNSHGRGVEQTLLGAGPVLEAFGNAKTVHNDNSSRFGKFIQVGFRPNGSVHGAVVEKYLLEKSRIVSQAGDERNYHIFYYLLSGAAEDMKGELFLKDAKQYHYLNQSGCYTIDGVDEVHEFERLKQSMDMVGFKPDLQKKIFSVISALLLLGNVEFIKKSSYHHDDAVQVKDNDLVSRITKLLNVRETSFLEALTSRRTTAGGETMVVNYKMEDAISARNAMAKCLYGAIFDWIVWQINHSLFLKQDHKDHKSHSIGVLDIFGFEDFAQNSFEQFCINYANEHLQYYFNQHIFKFEQEEYKKEKIEWKHIDFIDNTGCLDLFAKRPHGLFLLLDEESNFPGATDETLLEKFHHMQKSSQYYQAPVTKDSSFTIVHYAGKVKYKIKDFRQKNSDLIHSDLVAVLKNSNTGFIRELVGADRVAMLRWDYVRSCFRAMQAFIAAGKVSHARRIHSHSGANMVKRGYSLQKKSATFPRLNQTVNQLVSEGSEDHDDIDDIDSYIHSTAKKGFNIGRSQSHKKRQKLYKEYRQFKTAAKMREAPKAKAPSVSLQFQKSLQSLLETLDRSHPYFVRCIKSNEEKRSCHYDDKTVLRQLQYTGMLATVKLRQSGYNHRIPLEDFRDMYTVLLPNGSKSTQEDIETFLTSMDNDVDHFSFQVGTNKNFQLGITQVFLRETVKMLLDDALHHALMRHILRMQSWVRARLGRTRFVEMKLAAITVQKIWRGREARQKCAVLDKRRKEELKKKINAAMIIQNRFRSYHTIQNAKVHLRALKLEKEKCLLVEKEAHEAKVSLGESKSEDSKASGDSKVESKPAQVDPIPVQPDPTPGVPMTDIDSLSQSLDEETFRTAENDRNETGFFSTSEMVDSWIDKGAEADMNNKGDAEQSSDIVPKRPLHLKTSSSVASDTSKDEMLDSVKIEDLPANNNVEVPSSSSIKRRTSIERRSAFRRRSTKDRDAIRVIKKQQHNEDDLIPAGVAVRRTASPSDTSSDDITTTPKAPESSLFIQSPLSPTKNLENVSLEGSINHISSTPTHDRTSDKQLSPLLSPVSTQTDDSVKDMLGMKNAIVDPGDNAKSPELITTSEIADTPINIGTPAKTDTQEPTMAPYVLTDASDVIKTTEEQPSLNKSMETPHISSHTDSVKPMSPSLKDAFYIPNKDSDHEHSLVFSGPGDPNGVTSPNSNQHKSNLVKQQSIEYNEVLMRNFNDIKPTPSNGECSGKKLRRSSSNDPVYLRRNGSTASDQQRKSDVPIITGAMDIDNLPTVPSELDEQQLLSFNRAHQLRKGIRKSQSADSLANATKDFMLDGDNMVLEHSKVSKTDSASGQIEGAGLKKNPLMAVTGKHGETFDSDDSDLDGAFQQIGSFRPKRESYIPKSSVSSMDEPSKKKHAPQKTGQWNVSSMSEWHYPDNLEISEKEELSALNAHIFNKKLEFLGELEKRETETVFDKVFKQALREINHLLVSRLATAMREEKSWSPLKYRDLMAYFQDLLKANIQLIVSKEQVNEFPTPIAINAFRGYLDEFQKHHKPTHKKESKAKKKKERRKAREVIKIKSHMLVPMQFNIPTFCEVCNKMMFWNIKDRGLECEICKFSCHRKCAQRCDIYCQNQPDESASPSAVFGVPLAALSDEEGTTPPIIDRLIDALDRRGMTTDGIYRKSGAAARVRALKNCIDSDWRQVDLSEYPIHVLSLTLKNFFRELPEPLMTFDLFDEFIRCPDSASKEEAVAEMRATVEKLPLVNFNVMSRLMLHLARIAQNEPSNRMSPNALAIVFAPGLLRTKKPMSAQASLAQVPKLSRCLELIIEATLKKLNSTMQELDDLNNEEQATQDRLEHIRQSMRGPKKPKQLPKSSSSYSDLQEQPLPSPSSSEDFEIQAARLSRQLTQINQKKDRLTNNLPILTLGSSEDDGLSTDDIDSSGESLDDV